MVCVIMGMKVELIEVVSVLLVVGLLFMIIECVVEYLSVLRVSLVK